MDWGQKKAYAVSLIDVVPCKIQNKSRRGDTFIYYLKLSDKKVRVCRTMFINTLAIGEKQVAGWIKSSLSGSPSCNKPSATVKNISEAKKTLLEFLDWLPKIPSHYCRSTSSKLYLEPIINSKMDLFRIYQDHCETKNLRSLSRYQLSESLKEMGIGLFLPRKDQCDTCCSYQVGQVFEAEYQNHIANKNSARYEKAKDKCLAVEGQCHVLTMDVESVKVSPYLKASALYYKTKLMVHNFTINDLKSHHTVCYWWDESEGDLCASSFASCL